MTLEKLRLPLTTALRLEKAGLRCSPVAKSPITWSPGRKSPHSKSRPSAVLRCVESGKKVKNAAAEDDVAVSRNTARSREKNDAPRRSTGRCSASWIAVAVARAPKLFELLTSSELS